MGEIFSKAWEAFLEELGRSYLVGAIAVFLIASFVQWQRLPNHSIHDLYIIFSTGMSSSIALYVAAFTFCLVRAPVAIVKEKNMLIERLSTNGKSDFECVEEWLNIKISEWRTIQDQLSRPPQGDPLTEVLGDMRNINKWHKELFRIFRQIFKDEEIKRLKASKEFDWFAKSTSYRSHELENSLIEMRNNLTIDMLSPNFDRKSLNLGV